MKTSLIILLLALPFAAVAETLTWEPVTSRTDGTPLDPVEDLSEYRFYCGGVMTPIPASSTEGSYEVNKPDVLPEYGTYDCYLTAVDMGGLESEPSNTVSLSWIADPKPPTNFLIVR